MLLGTLGASLLGDILTAWGINRAREGAIAKRQCQGYGNERQDHKNKMDF